MHPVPELFEKESHRWYNHETESNYWYEEALGALNKRLNTDINTNVAKNIIIYLGDGMSIPTLFAARAYKGQLDGKFGEEDELYWETFPYTGLSKHRENFNEVLKKLGSNVEKLESSSEKLGSHLKKLGLSLKKPESSLEKLESTDLTQDMCNVLSQTYFRLTWCIDGQVPDSACTSTAYMTGVKSKLKTIGINGNVIRGDCKSQNNKKNHVDSILKLAQDKNKSIGIVTTTRVTHASPAGGYAHVAHRDWESDYDMILDNIDSNKCMDTAKQLITQYPGNEFKVIFGGGRKKFLPHNIEDEENVEGERLDGMNLIEMWKDDKKKRGDKYLYLWNKTLLMDVIKYPENYDFVLGLFDPSHLPYHLETNSEIKPSLEEMTEAAIKILRKNNDGFILFVEGGRIDHAHHGTYATLALDETLELSKAVKIGREITSIKDTLIIVTSDHGHTMSVAGYSDRGKKINGINGAIAIDNLKYTTLNYANGPGYKEPNESGGRYNISEDNIDDVRYQFSSMVPLKRETHGGEDVAIFSSGPWSHLFTGTIQQSNIPHFLAYASCLAPKSALITFDILGISLDDIKNVFNYVNVVYQKGIEYANKDELEKMNPEEQMREIMSELKDISDKLTNFVSHQDEKMDEIVKILLNNIEVTGDFQSARNVLIDAITNIDFWFRNGMEYETNEGYSNKTLQSFAESVLWGTDRVDHSLYKIYELIFPDIDDNLRKNFLSLTLEHTRDNYLLLCDKYISAQQQFYYIFAIVIQIQVKAFITVTQAYTLQTTFDHANYTHDYKAFKQTFYERLMNYFESFIYYMALFPADIRRCDVENPVLGENIFQMEGVFQVIVGLEFNIKQAIYPEFLLVCGGCEEISNNNRMEFMIYDCKSYSSMSVCDESGMGTRFSALRVSSYKTDSESFGHSDRCDHDFSKLSGIYSPTLCYNDLCVCSVNTTDQTNFPDVDYGIILDPPKIKKISVDPQFSDTANDMVVVGVKFILHDNAIHLQIQQAKISKDFTIADEGSWKPVNIDKNNNTINITYETMFDRRSIFYLDDVMVNPDYVVTGVKLAINKD
ncbi:hypothetical protein PV326_008192, partial [Microctonus aethiopoides]